MGFSEASESITWIVSLTDSRVFRVHHHRRPHLQLLKYLKNGRNILGVGFETAADGDMEKGGWFCMN